jgi:hypothetical protein
LGLRVNKGDIMNNLKHKDRVSEQAWTPLSPRLGDVEDLSIFLGCSKGHIYNLVWKKELVGNKASGLKFKGIDVQNFIDEREKR